MIARRGIIKKAAALISSEVGHIHYSHAGDAKGAILVGVRMQTVDTYATITDPMNPNLLLGGSRYVDEYGVGKEAGPPPASMDVRAHHPKRGQVRLERTTAHACICVGSAPEKR